MYFSFLNTDGVIFFFPDTLTCFIKEVNGGEESAFPSKLVALTLQAVRQAWMYKHLRLFAQLMPQSSRAALLHALHRQDEYRL